MFLYHRANCGQVIGNAGGGFIVSNQNRLDFRFSPESLAYSLYLSGFAPFKAKRDYLGSELLGNSAEALSEDADRYR